jgi:hypothetical protein
MQPNKQFCSCGYNTNVLAESSLATQTEQRIQCPLSFGISDLTCMKIKANKLASIFKTSSLMLYFQSLHAFTCILVCKKNVLVCVANLNGLAKCSSTIRK